PARLPAPPPPQCKTPSPAAPRRSSSSTPTCDPAESPRTGSSCPLPNRSPHRPCPHRPPPADDPSHTRDASADRTPPTIPSAPPQGSADKTRLTPPRSKSPRTAESSTASPCTSCCRARAKTAPPPPHSPDAPVPPHPPRCKCSSPRYAPATTTPRNQALAGSPRPCPGACAERSRRVPLSLRLLVP